MEDNSHKTPLDYAIKNNEAKIVETILNSLIKIDHFSLSKMVYRHFSKIFVNMNSKAFEAYLNSCYFVTQQMMSISNANIGDETIREVHYSCILDKKFYKKYEIN